VIYGKQMRHSLTYNDDSWRFHLRLLCAAPQPSYAVALDPTGGVMAAIVLPVHRDQLLAVSIVSPFWHIQFNILHTYFKKRKCID
jgi:hypothetical protein